MQEIHRALQSVAVGPAVAHGNLVMYPLSAPASAAPADYLVLDEALARDLIRITEVNEQGRVPELLVSNDAEQRVLLLDGEELVGAKQNRVLNLTILVGARQTLVVPVSCVEQGRWRYRTESFRAADRTLFARARAEKLRQVTRSMQHTGTYAADQNAMWTSVAMRVADLDVDAPTGAMADIYEQRSERLAAYARAVTAQAGQIGAAFAIDGELVGLELLDAPDAFAKVFPKLLNGYALDAVAGDGRSDKGGGAARSTIGPAAARLHAGPEAVQGLIAAILRAGHTQHEALGEGFDVRLESEAVVGGALIADGRLVDLSAFAAASTGAARERRRYFPGPRRAQ